MGSPPIVYACLINLIHYGNSKQGKEIGNRGVAITGDKSFQLVCYEQTTQKQEVAVPITAKTTFSLLPGHFVRFKDENKEIWAIRGAHDKVLKLCQHLAIVKSLAPGALKAPIVQELELGEGRPLAAGDGVKADITVMKTSLDEPGQLGEVVRSWPLKRVKVQQGKGKVAKAIEDGLLGMKKGGRRLLVVAASHLSGGKGEDDLGALGLPSLLIDIDVKKTKFATPDPPEVTITTTPAEEPVLMLTGPPATPTASSGNVTPAAASEPSSSIDRSSTLQVSEARAAFAAMKGMYNSGETSDNKPEKETQDKEGDTTEPGAEKTEQPEKIMEKTTKKPERKQSVKEAKEPEPIKHEDDDPTPLNAEFRANFTRLDTKLKGLERNLAANLQEEEWDDGTVTIQGVILSFRALMADRELQAEANQRQSQHIEQLRTKLDEALTQRTLNQSERSEAQEQRIAALRKELAVSNEQLGLSGKLAEKLGEELNEQKQKTSEAESKVEICLTRMRADRVKFNAHVDELQSRLSQLTAQLSAGTEQNELYRLQIAQHELKSKGARTEAEVAELKELQNREQAQAEARVARVGEQARLEGFKLGKEEGARETAAQKEAELQQAVAAARASGAEEGLSRARAQAELQLKQVKDEAAALEASLQQTTAELEQARTRAKELAKETLSRQQACSQLEQEVKRLGTENSQLEQSHSALTQALHASRTSQQQLEQQHEQQRASEATQAEQTKAALATALQRNQQLEAQMQQLGDHAKASLGGTMQAQQLFEQQLTLARGEVGRLAAELQKANSALAESQEALAKAEQQTSSELPALALPPPVAESSPSPDPRLLEEIANLTKQLAEQKLEKEQLQQSIGVEKEKAKKEKKEKKKEKKNKEEKKSKSRDKDNKQPQEQQQQPQQPPQQQQQEAPKRKEPAEAVFFEELAADQSNVLPELDLNAEDSED